MRKSSIRAVTALGLWAVFWAAPGPRAEAIETIRLNGSGSALAMMRTLSSAYIAEHPDVRFEMGKPLGSSGAVKALLAGVLDLAVSSRPLAPEESAKGAVAREYGKTPLLIVTEKHVPLANIATGELEDLYAGLRRTWSNGEPIRIVLRPEVDSETKILKVLSSGMSQALDAARARPGMIVAVTDPESNDLVSRSPGAIGTSTLVGIRGDHPSLNVLSLNGVPGTPETLADGSYPLAKGFYFVTTAKTSESTGKFLNFIASPRGRTLVRSLGVLVTMGDQPSP